MAWPVIAMGLAMKAYGQFTANNDQADAEDQNAAFYREQADFARKAGDRQRMIFDRESVILLGNQTAGFAKSGVSTTSAADFLAREMLYRQEESQAIKEEADFNVRLAMLRADQSERTADSLRDPFNNLMSIGGGFLSSGASYV